MTSFLPTADVTEPDNDVCARVEQSLSQLQTQLQTGLAQLHTAVSQLQSDVTVLKEAIPGIGKMLMLLLMMMMMKTNECALAWHKSADCKDT